MTWKYSPSHSQDNITFKLTLPVEYSLDAYHYSLYPAIVIPHCDLTQSDVDAETTQQAGR